MKLEDFKRVSIVFTNFKMPLKSKLHQDYSSAFKRKFHDEFEKMNLSDIITITRVITKQPLKTFSPLIDLLNTFLHKE